jgi:transcriptional regulator with XRE-family HTH domain
VKQRYRTLADYFKQTETSQTALAQKLRISKAYVSLIVKGERQPSLRLALRIEEATGVPAASMVLTSERAAS